MSSLEKVLILLMAAFVVGLGTMAYNILNNEVSNSPGETLPPKKVLARDAGDAVGSVAHAVGATARETAIRTEVEAPELIEPSSRRPHDPAKDGLVKGLVLQADGQPVEGATIELFEGSNTLIPIAAARKRLGIDGRSDGKGNFVIPGLPPAANYVVVASHADYTSAEVGPITVKAGGATFVGRLYLRQGLAVFGRVTDKSGRPVKGAEVALSDQYASAFLSTAERKAWKAVLTNDNGEYRFERLNFSSFQLTVSAAGFGTQVRTNASFMRRAEDCELNFELDSAQRITGSVTDARGAPLAGVEVSATLINSRYSSRGFASTDPSGKFVIDNLIDGCYMMHFSKYGYSRSLLQRVETGGELVRVSMQPNGAVEARVVDAKTLAPVTEFAVTVKKYREGRPLQNVETVVRQSAPDGSFRVDNLDPELYALYITADGYAVAESTPIQIERSQTHQGLVIHMDRGGKVAGRLIDPDGRPVPGACVTVNPNNFHANPLIELFGGLNEDPSLPQLMTTSASDGRFAVDRITGGTYQIAVEHPAYSKKAINDINVDRGQTCDVGDILISNGGSLVGKVLDTSGKILAGATVNAATRTGFLRTVRSGEDGLYRIENLPPGNYNVSIQDWVQDPGEDLHPLMRLVYAKNSTLEVYVEDGRTVQADLRLSESP
ncbi:MAG: carboxypeptidase-like regulatory domain-containing protein [Planctomycetota bacterium]